MMSKEEIYNLFNQLYKKKGKYITFSEVCKEVKCCEKTFRKWMKAVDAFDNCPDVFRQIMKTIHCFDTITSESAYWIGYLLADGCYTTNSAANGYRLMLECKTDDVEILEKFCDFVGIRQDRISIGHQNKSRALSLADSNFSTSVSKYGITQNKSHHENHVPQEIYKNDEFFLQFLKGLIDGDGTIHISPASRGISIVSNSQELLQEIKNKLEILLPYPNSIWLMTKPQDAIRLATQDLYVLKIGVGKTLNNLSYLYHHFYDNHPIILTRKEQSLKNIVLETTGSL